MVEVINDDVSLTAIRAPAVKDELATRQRSLTTLITLTAMKGVDGHCDALPNVSVTSASLMLQWRLAPAGPKAGGLWTQLRCLPRTAAKTPGGSEVPLPWRSGRWRGLLRR